MQMSSMTGIFAKMVQVLVFNYMVIQGELHMDFAEQEYYVSFADLYGAMISTPFFGKYYTTITIISLLILTFGFFILFLNKWKGKFLLSATLYTLGSEGNDPTASKDEAERKKRHTQKSMHEFASRHDRILEGERAVLKELDDEKKKAGRQRGVNFAIGQQMMGGSVTS